MESILASHRFSQALIFIFPNSSKQSIKRMTNVSIFEWTFYLCWQRKSSLSSACHPFRDILTNAAPFHLKYSIRACTIATMCCLFFLGPQNIFGLTTLFAFIYFKPNIIEITELYSVIVCQSNDHLKKWKQFSNIFRSIPTFCASEP